MKDTPSSFQLINYSFINKQVKEYKNEDNNCYVSTIHLLLYSINMNKHKHIHIILIPSACQKVRERKWRESDYNPA
jgi:hypothetical protein